MCNCVQVYYGQKINKKPERKFFGSSEEDITLYKKTEKTNGEEWFIVDLKNKVTFFLFIRINTKKLDSKTKTISQ